MHVSFDQTTSKKQMLKKLRCVDRMNQNTAVYVSTASNAFKDTAK